MMDQFNGERPSERKVSGITMESINTVFKFIKNIGRNQTLPPHANTNFKFILCQKLPGFIICQEIAVCLMNRNSIFLRQKRQTLIA